MIKFGRTMTHKTHLIVALVFDDYETLDLHGPIEMLGHAPNTKILIVSEKEMAKSSQGTMLYCNSQIENTIPCQLFMTVGGLGTRTEVNNPKVINWIKSQTAVSEKVFSVCTGSALLAKAGVLDGVSATTNKLAYQWVTSLNPQVLWQAKARWVNDARFLTSSGVSAGIDASLAYIAETFGYDEAKRIEAITEYHWNDDANNDPYACLTNN
ncbi:thiamine biosynthesis protein ThiJ [Photobacterium swingsii]|uniref:DJ-1/PfpI family protein n=2 Tax=Photobacterium swingsii TaxID=680026 RepID=A0A0J8VE87_9GAMM|nr:thiamine biosynthesis protein ThiJ [Photobacterium swingsii]PSW25835.1 DJ-1/PfpI family protein [Photobacterium swingsii]